MDTKLDKPAFGNRDSKKTWELVNRIRGKQHRQLKPMFIIDIEKNNKP